ncbi:MAG: 2-oxoacid:acceptor oxidoreductase family protein, partial [Desulfurococcaceae archaeon]|nr:2-oxoacid:acceptor oxidoreductase family protein [Desulfurococcaceae archaeon]
MRWHGRGGQGVWTVSNLLAEAAIREGKYAQSFPTFGPERMGAPIAAFTRISDSEIEIHSDIYEPDVVVVLDSTLVGYEDFISGLKSGGVLLINF